MPSTVVAKFRYNPASLDLYIQFVSGRLYRYKNVPEELFQEMRKAFPKGKFFNEKIKGHYTFEQLP